jgi:scyllo-inositol 2-dehydrogenase (NADP+)
VRVALVGYGMAGSLFHAPLVRATEGMRLESVVTANPQRQARCLADNPGVGLLDSPGALWERAAEHDLVVIATPTGNHVDTGLEAVAHGLAVVVDKPLAPTAAEGRRLVEAAGRAGLFLSVFHNRRWDSDTLTIERLQASGQLGAIARFESRFERWRPEAVAGAWREEVRPAEGGGIVLDLGSHVIDQALHLFGPASQVYAEIAARRPGSVEDDAFIALTHQDGVRSHLWVSAVAALAGPRVKVLGAAGAYRQDNLDGQEAALRAGVRPGGDRSGPVPEPGSGVLASRDGQLHVDPVAGNWPAYYRAVAAALREGAANPVTPASALAVLEVIDAARLSAAGNGVVALP